mmetsp:Transcript_45135/g.118413  ORF Transcript_45135/g.118413 Transcript_45135/m.118413 type:complete len:259 (-) Transcript_45135:91-867(-)
MAPAPSPPGPSGELIAVGRCAGPLPVAHDASSASASNAVSVAPAEGGRGCGDAAASAAEPSRAMAVAIGMPDALPATLQFPFVASLAAPKAPDGSRRTNPGSSSARLGNPISVTSTWLLVASASSTAMAESPGVKGPRCAARRMRMSLRSWFITRRRWICCSLMVRAFSYTTSAFWRLTSICCACDTCWVSRDSSRLAVAASCACMCSIPRLSWSCCRSCASSRFACCWNRLAIISMDTSLGSVPWAIDDSDGRGGST